MTSTPIQTTAPVFDAIRAQLATAQAANADALRHAAELLADCTARDGMIHAFGTGHSHMLAEELFTRSGGFANVNAILDSGLMLHESALASSDLERLEGYAAIVLSRYQVSAGDVMIVISHSGRNPAPIEMALLARERGLPVIAVTAKAYSLSQPSRHSNGKRLCEVADVVLDTCGFAGDGALSLAGVDMPVVATSTILGATLIQAMTYEATRLLLARGITPPLIASYNNDAHESSHASFEKYKARARHA